MGTISVERFIEGVKKGKIDKSKIIEREEKFRKVAINYGFKLGYAACMRENGATYVKIAEKLKISEAAVRNMFKTEKVNKGSK